MGEKGLVTGNPQLRLGYPSSTLIPNNAERSSNSEKRVHGLCSQGKG